MSENALINAEHTLHEYYRNALFDDKGYRHAVACVGLALEALCKCVLVRRNEYDNRKSIFKKKYKNGGNDTLVTLINYLHDIEEIPVSARSIMHFTRDQGNDARHEVTIPITANQASRLRMELCGMIEWYKEKYTISKDSALWVPVFRKNVEKEFLEIVVNLSLIHI